MIRIIKAAGRHFRDFGWLKTYWLFSFDTYKDANNVRFGALRVFNDDEVAPGTGFGSHPHREMEIVTVVLDGQLTHEDDAGHARILGPGGVQVMSAGTGIQHSEHNKSDRPLHFYQLWFFPRERDLEPRYEERKFPLTGRINSLLPVASGRGESGALAINVDASVYLSELEDMQGFDYAVDIDRGVFVYVTSGDLTINGETLITNDQARISETPTLELSTQGGSEFVLVDVPMI